MATVTKSSITLNGSIANSGSYTSGGLVLYTAPAGTFAIVQICVAQTGPVSVNLLIGGEVLAGIATSAVDTFTGIHVGPGQSVSISAVATATGSAYVSGVSYINS